MLVPAGKAAFGRVTRGYPVRFSSQQIRAFLSAVLPCATCVYASAQVQQPSDDSLRFDVVSIRPSSAIAKETHLAIQPDGYEAIGMPLATTLLLAYVPAPFFAHLDEVKGAPSWVSSEQYDIRAKLPPALAARWKDLRQNIAQTPVELQAMLRATLAERCNLRIHSIPSQTDGYALRLQKQSPALEESAVLPSTDEVMQLPDGAKAVFTVEHGVRTYTLYNTSMPLLASFLSLQTGRLVVDETDMPGRYKFVVRRISSTPEGKDSGPQVDAPIPFDLRSLGIKVVHTKVKSVTWVVDSMERPTAN